jgi:hypothetical protein
VHAANSAWRREPPTSRVAEQIVASSPAIAVHWTSWA